MSQQNNATTEPIKNEMAVEALRWILDEIVNRKQEADREAKDDFTKGRRLAYFEMHEIIKSRLDILDISFDDE